MIFEVNPVSGGRVLPVKNCRTAATVKACDASLSSTTCSSVPFSTSASASASMASFPSAKHTKGLVIFMMTGATHCNPMGLKYCKYMSILYICLGYTIHIECPASLYVYHIYGHVWLFAGLKCILTVKCGLEIFVREQSNYVY